MKYLKVVFIIFMLFISISCKKEKEVTLESLNTVLIGEIIDRPTDTLLLVKASDDVRSDIKAKIPVIDNKFSFSFEADEILAYHLIFQDEFINTGGYRPIIFFSERDTIHFVLNDNDAFDNNKIVGNEVNKEYNIYNKIVSRDFYSRYDSIKEKYKSYDYKDFQSKDYIKLMAQLSLAKTQKEKVPIYQKRKKLQEQGLDRSELGKVQDAEYEVIRKELEGYKYNYISKNPTLVSYNLLLDDITSYNYNPTPKEKLIEAFNTLHKKFPTHSYTDLSQNLLNGIFQLQPGGQYVNFKATDVNGNETELKTILKENKIVLLNLWATWCGPCIAKTRLAKPVYEKYKNEGFTILGVAGEHKNLNTYNSFMKKEQWPWKQLIELDKQNKIWEKYNVMNGGGGMFLIDSSGEILAVNPSSEALDTILNNKLVPNKVKL